MGRGEVHDHPRVGGQPLSDLVVFVGRVVVHHQVQLAGGVGPRDLFEEGQKLLVPVPWLDRGGDLPGGHLQRGEQGRGAMPDVVVAAALGQLRQDRRGPFQGLDLRVLIDREHDRVLRRRQIQPDHVDHVGDQLRVGRSRRPPAA
jgi:hypothetical protein